jgi:hypothetical protein
MAALNFVAVEDGLEDDPKLLGLAQLLKEHRSRGVWYVVMLRRLILRCGNHLTGSLPKNYTGEDVAAFLEFKGAPRRLVDAMKKQGYLSFKKGRGFFYPAWVNTITGQYARRREEDRLRKEKERRHGRGHHVGPSSDVLGLSSDEPTDGPRTSVGHSIGRKQGSSSDLPPDPPPAGGASLADARWEWLSKYAPTLQNRNACKVMLAAMSVEDWALTQQAYGLLHTPGSSISKKNSRVLHWPTEQFLRRQAYLRFASQPRPIKTMAIPHIAHNPAKLAAEMEARAAERDKFLLDLLRDPDLPAKKRHEARERWRADPQNHDRQAPWERARDHDSETPAPAESPKERVSP